MTIDSFSYTHGNTHTSTKALPSAGVCVSEILENMHLWPQTHTQDAGHKSRQQHTSEPEVHARLARHYLVFVLTLLPPLKLGRPVSQFPLVMLITGPGVCLFFTLSSALGQIKRTEFGASLTETSHARVFNIFSVQKAQWYFPWATNPLLRKAASEEILRMSSVLIYSCSARGTVIYSLSSKPSLEEILPREILSSALKYLMATHECLLFLTRCKREIIARNLVKTNQFRLHQIFFSPPLLYDTGMSFHPQ